jgi:protein gp37
MGDLFHEQVKYAYINEIFKIMRVAAGHTFILLTKRPERIPDIFDYLDYGTPCGGVLPNLWLGVTCENQEIADKRFS